MPEQITKYPDVTLQVLQSAGAQCGKGAPQKILTQCPKERFCALPGGELCVYGVDQIAQMTQLTPQDLAAATGGNAARSTEISTVEALSVAAVFIAGVVFGRFWPRVRNRT